MHLEGSGNLNQMKLLILLNALTVEACKKNYIEYKEFGMPQTEHFRFNKKQVKEVNNAMTRGADF